VTGWVSRSTERPAARARIPADVERPDKLLGNLTGRQLVILATAGIALWAGYLGTRHVVPLAGFAAVAGPLALVAVTLALGRAEGLSADRLAVAAWRQWRSPRRLVPAPAGVPPVPECIGIEPGPMPAPLRLPLAGVGADGVVDLGPEGAAVLCRASSVTFSLRTAAEQEALVAGYGRWLNSLAEPVQVLVRAEPVDLAPMIEALEDAAPALPHPGLETAATEHARFLADLGARRTLLRRQVLVVLRQPPGTDAAERLARRAAEATAALAAAGVVLTVLDGPAARAALVAAVDPVARRPSGIAAPEETITKGDR
jgi:hypothetical protein